MSTCTLANVTTKEANLKSWSYHTTEMESAHSLKNRPPTEQEAVGNRQRRVYALIFKSYFGKKMLISNQLQQIFKIGFVNYCGLTTAYIEYDY